jgi:hypothetical protein
MRNSAAAASRVGLAKYIWVPEMLQSGEARRLIAEGVPALSEKRAGAGQLHLRWHTLVTIHYEAGEVGMYRLKKSSDTCVQAKSTHLPHRHGRCRVTGVFDFSQRCDPFQIQCAGAPLRCEQSLVGAHELIDGTDRLGAIHEESAQRRDGFGERCHQQEGEHQPGNRVHSTCACIAPQPGP